MPLRRAVLAGVALLAVPSARAADPPVVAAAADLKFALEAIAAQWRTRTGGDVRLAFGSSGNFARQLGQGAPFDLFLSADEDLVFRLADAGLTRDRGALYAIGRIALFAPPGSPLDAARGLDGLREALAAGRIVRFAIANPEHAPYGRAAEQALIAAGLWEAIRPRLVLGENVAQAAQFATTGGAQGGLIALSLARAPEFAGRGAFAVVPDSLHAPLRQRMVLMRAARTPAAAFHDFLQSPPAREIFVRFGFALPGEA